MKKSLILFSVSLLLFAGCKKEQVTPDPVPTPTPPVPHQIAVEEKNTSIYNKLTATWCGPCGSWGWTLNNDITTAIGTDGIPMATFGDTRTDWGNGDFFNQTARDFKLTFAPTAGWPAFCINGVNVTEYSTTGSIYTTITKNNAVNAVNNHKNAPVLVNSGYETTIAGDSIVIKTRTKFFTDLTGEYYIGAYVLEDGALHIQAGQSGTVAHHHVLRGSATSGSSWGELITSATTAGSTFDHTFTMNLNAGWTQDNIEVATVIWKKNGSSYEFVNAYKQQ